MKNGSVGARIGGRAGADSPFAACVPTLRVLLSGGLAATLLTACSGADHPSERSASATSATATSSSSTGTTAPTTSSPARSTPRSTVTTSGGIEVRVPSRTLRTAPAVALDSTARPASSVSARVVSVARVHATAKGPGEVSGPAFRVAFSVTNKQSRPLDLAGVTATLTDERGVPAVQLSNSRGDPFSGELAAGRTARAVYLFSQPKSFTQPVTIALQLSSSLTVVQFEGRV